MSDPIPLLLACAAGPLLPLAFAALWARRVPAVPVAATLLSGFLPILALIWLIFSAEPAGWATPLGGTELGFGMDALNGPTLVIVTILGACVIAHVARADPERLGPPLATLATAIQTAMATTPPAQALGFAALGLALAWGAERRGAARAIIGLTSWIGLTVALAGWTARSWLPTPLILVGPFLALILPLRLPPHLGAMACATLIPLSGMATIRFMVAAEASHLAIVFALVSLGVGVGFLTAHRAGMARDLSGLTWSLLGALGGLIPIAAALAAQARAADLPDLTTAALSAGFGLVIAQSLGGTLVFLTVDQIKASAGTTRLIRLGGLWRLMPLTSVAWLIGSLALLAVPPSVGFAAFWWFWQAILTSPRGGIATAAPQTLIGVALVGVAGLGLMALMRAAAAAFLGRPRHPRAAGATDPDNRLSPVIALAALATILGLFPGLMVALTGPTLRGLTDGTPPNEPVWYGLVSTDLYAPVIILLIVASLTILAARFTARPVADQAAPHPWQGGHGPIPPWMPHGDALTQTDGTGFTLATKIWPKRRIVIAPWLALVRDRVLVRLVPWLPAAALGVSLLPRLAATP